MEHCTAPLQTLRVASAESHLTARRQSRQELLHQQNSLTLHSKQPLQHLHSGLRLTTAHLKVSSTNHHKQQTTCLAIFAFDMGIGCRSLQCTRQLCPASVSMLSTQRSGQLPSPPTQPPAAQTFAGQPPLKHPVDSKQLQFHSRLPQGHVLHKAA